MATKTPLLDTAPARTQKRQAKRPPPDTRHHICAMTDPVQPSCDPKASSALLLACESVINGMCEKDRYEGVRSSLASNLTPELRPRAHRISNEYIDEFIGQLNEYVETFFLTYNIPEL